MDDIYFEIYLLDSCREEIIDASHEYFSKQLETILLHPKLRVDQ